MTTSQRIHLMSDSRAQTLAQKIKSIAAQLKAHTSKRNCRTKLVAGPTSTNTGAVICTYMCDDVEVEE